MTSKIAREVTRILDGRQIRDARLDLGMTQMEFAVELHTDPSSVSRWENGKSTPNRIYLKEIKRLLDRERKKAEYQAKKIPNIR